MKYNIVVNAVVKISIMIQLSSFSSLDDRLYTVCMHTYGNLGVSCKHHGHHGISMENVTGHPLPLWATQLLACVEILKLSTGS